jgi:hypothetical protein
VHDDVVRQESRELFLGGVTGFAQLTDLMHARGSPLRLQDLFAVAGGIGSATSVAIFQPSGVRIHVTIIRNVSALASGRRRTH